MMATYVLRRAFRSLSPSMLKESSLSLLLSISVDLLAGWLLITNLNVFSAYAGLLIIVPGMFAIRGSVFSALASRLGSTMHLGALSFSSKDTRFLFRNVVVVMIQSLLLSTVLIILATIGSFVLPIDINLRAVMDIAVMGNVISSTFLLGVAFLTAYISYVKELDPDNVSIPVISASGDFITIPSLLLAMYIHVTVGCISEVVSFALISLSIVFSIYIIKRDRIHGSLIKQSLPLMTFAALLETLAGFFLNSFPSEELILIAPAFVAEGGAILGIISSRRSSRYMLGMGSLVVFGEDSISESLAAVILGVFAYIIIFSIFKALGMVGYGILLVLITAGLVLIVPLSFLGVLITRYAVKLNIDPDNAVIPVMSTTMDVLGYAALLYIGSLFI